MNILVTGIAGQIGRRLSEILTRNGILHCGIDIIPYETEIPYLETDLIYSDTKTRLKEFLEPVTHVVHLAARMSNTTEFHKGLEEQFRISVLGTLNLLEVLPEQLEHFLFASSMTVFGKPVKNPVDETHSVSPQNLYALGKLAAERYLFLFCKTPLAILRYSSVYGPGSITNRAVPNMIERALDGFPPNISGSGKTFRDYIYIDDVCDITMEACKRKASGLFNIGSGVKTNVSQLANKIMQATGLEGEPVYHYDKQDGYSIYFAIDKMKQEIGTTSMIDLTEGLSRTVNWHKKIRENSQ
jgi:nucleoside-diphosphate-sugar epimerase